jgi:hypothetical protein
MSARRAGSVASARYSSQERFQGGRAAKAQEGGKRSHCWKVSEYARLMRCGRCQTAAHLPAWATSPDARTLSRRRGAQSTFEGSPVQPRFRGLPSRLRGTGRDIPADFALIQIDRVQRAPRGSKRRVILRVAEPNPNRSVRKSPARNGPESASTLPSTHVQ